MDNIKHTPGPWEYDVTDFCNGKVEYGIFQPATQTPGDTVDYIATVHDDGTEADARLIAEAPAMLEALRKISQGADCFTFNSDADAFRFVDMVAEIVAPVLARIDGAAPAPTAPAPVSAPGFAAHALDTLKDCEAWFANGGDVDGVFFDDATMLDRVRESLALATPTAQPAGAIGEAGHAAAIEAAQGYVSAPEIWNAPSPEQVAGLLQLLGVGLAPVAANDDADLIEAAAGDTCQACGRASLDCSRAPCPTVVAERGEG